MISGNRLARVGAQRGMTLLEMVVAIGIILTIMSGVVWSFVKLLESHDEARGRMEATANARAAMEVLSVEIKRARNTTGTLVTPSVFVGQTDSSTGDGDLVDQDEDGSVDEELFNAMDDDGDWVVASSDRHALIPFGAVQYAERPVFYQEADLGDAGIDEDLGATSATLEFETFDVPGEVLQRKVKFYVGNDADGVPNTLMREIRGVDPSTGANVVTSGPVCYNVVSFGAMFWDHSLAKDSTANPWLTEWPPATPPLTAAPSTVYLHISVYAGTPLTLQELPPGTQLDTVQLSTLVNVEAVLADPTYFAQRTTVFPVTP